ncbi:MAG: SgcJ/EcaC family oxidoreductase [Vicinamibacterales bacterium]
MNQHGLRVAFLLVVGSLCPLESLAQQSDVTAIRALEVRQAEAWNRHDAAAYSDLFTQDGDVVNVLGWWWQGPAEIKAKLADGFAYVFKESKLTITDVHVRLLDANNAVAHVRWTMEGAKAPPGAPNPPSQGIQLQVLRKEGDQWRIASFQNTNSVPETPFPKGPRAMEKNF